MIFAITIVLAIFIISSVLLPNKPSKKAEEFKFVPELWPDDYCQIEFVPQENKEFVLKQIAERAALSEETATEFGYTDILERGDMPVTILSKEFRVEYLEKTLESLQFTKAEYILLENKTKLYHESSAIKAFHFRGFTIFYEVEEDEFIKHLWLNTSLITSDAQLNAIENAFYIFGEECDLILVDWNDESIVNLKNHKEIHKYLWDYWK